MMRAMWCRGALFCLFQAGTALWGASGDSWWNHQVFYEVYVRAFQDSNGDGHGDLKGLISRLDYLNDGNPATREDLGVTALWLMPVFQAQSQHGYDTIDYRDIEKDYGTVDDLRLLIREAHKRGIKIIVDLVLNHTAHTHPWFVKALEEARGGGAVPGPSRLNWYRFTTQPDNRFWREMEGTVPKQYFYGWFNPTMPDLNYENPAVTDEMLDVARFWITQVGVDGYRLDAIKYLVEEGPKDANTPANHAWFRNFHKVVKQANPQAFLVGEVWDDLPTVLSYTGDQMDVNFHFPLSQAISDSVGGGRSAPVVKVLKETLEAFPPGQYATFLRNHDQRRLMNDFQGSQPKALQAAALLLTLPGIPFLYYGEEIGLSQNRRAMQWDHRAPFWGFSEKKVFPNGQQEKDPAFTISSQTGDPGSLLSSYRRLIRLRTDREVLRSGSLELLDAGNPGVLAYLRILGQERFLVVHNLGDVPVAEYGLILPQALARTGAEVSTVYGPAFVSSGSPQKISSANLAYKPFSRLEARGSWVFELK